MLNEAPKKAKPKKDYSDPTKWQLFWRTQRECLRRSVTPYLMYLFMSLLLLACQTIDSNGTSAVEIVLGILCIAGGAFFNAHLCYNYGIFHYGAYVAGKLHRRNKAFGIPSGGDHRPEREYRPWKGFLIGFYIGLPVAFLGILAGALPVSTLMGYAYYAFAMFAGWAIIPITWFGTKSTAGEVGLAVSPYYAILFILLPILVSGVAYLVGAYVERSKRLKEEDRRNKVDEAGGYKTEKGKRK